MGENDTVDEYNVRAIRLLAGGGTGGSKKERIRELMLRFLCMKFSKATKCSHLAVWHNSIVTALILDCLSLVCPTTLMGPWAVTR